MKDDTPSTFFLDSRTPLLPRSAAARRSRRPSSPPLLEAGRLRSIIMLRGLGGVDKGNDVGGAALTSRFSSLADPLTPSILCDEGAFRPLRFRWKAILDLFVSEFFRKSTELCNSDGLFLCRRSCVCRFARSSANTNASKLAATVPGRGLVAADFLGMLLVTAAF